MGSQSVYPYSQDKVREQLRLVLDLLLDNGADYHVWMEEGYYPKLSPGPSVRALFFENINNVSWKNEEYLQVRAFLQSYFEALGKDA